MKKEDVLRNCTFEVVGRKGAIQDVVKKGPEIIGKFGVRDSDDRIIVPLEYDFLEQVNENLFVGTKGSINGLRYTHGRITCSTEKGGTYGVVFDRMLENKTLDTEVEFYTIKGKKLNFNKKILAAFVCKNDDMFVIVDENYKWSMILIDHQNNVILNGAYTDVDSITMDYCHNRFIVAFNKEYVIVSFKDDNRIDETTPLLLCEPVELSKRGAIVKLNDKYGFIDYSGKVILSSMYDDIWLQKSYIKATINGHEELYTYSGKFIVGGENYVSSESYDLDEADLILLRHKDGTYCLFSSDKQILPCEYSSIVMREEFAIVCKDAKYGLLKYDKESDEMVAVFPENFPDEGYDKMRFDYTKVATYVMAEKRAFPINKVYRYDLVAFKD